MQLTEEDMRLIAQLTSDPGYMLLIDSIQADLDDLADRMEQEQDDRRLAGLTREWQATRKVVAALRTRPERIREEYAGMDHFPDELRPASAPRPAPPVPPKQNLPMGKVKL